MLPATSHQAACGFPSGAGLPWKTKEHAVHTALQRFTRSSIDLIALHLGVIAIFAVFGTIKWFDFEVQALQPLLTTTWLKVLHDLFGAHGASYFLGVVETLAFVALIVGFGKPQYGAAGSLLVVLTAIVTLSLLPQLDALDSFIFKDILLIGAGLTLLKHDLLRWQAVARVKPALPGG
jgi:uncharacterized membrane protein YkgB